MQFALPDDPDLDVFESGVEEVDRYFRSREWFSAAKGKAAPPTYQFKTHDGGEIVGYAAVAFRKCGHPNDDATDKAKYLAVYVAGVYRAFQGKKNPRSPDESFAVSLFRTLERFASDKQDCRGLYLWVRTDNSRAIRFYRKFGFIDDPAGPVQRDSGAPHLTMRKPLDGDTR